MNKVDELYKLWYNSATRDVDLLDELESIKSDKDAIFDRFYRNLEFGTAGLRGVIGAGTNRMNIYTVNQATQGLADYLKDTFDKPAVAIAYDSRIKSDILAKSAASVLAANGIKVYIFSELVPTPMLSFAVRRLNCKSGIIITASHNPSKYNGYKCYDPNGYQMTDEAANKTYEYIQKVDMFKGVKITDFDVAVETQKIEYIGNWLKEEFYELVERQCINKEICSGSDLKIIYTPLNGTGNKPVRHILSALGFSNVTVVPEQENPDGNFPTCPFPNPEIRQVFELAIEMAKENQADLLLATDPDCDRVGIAVRTGKDYQLMTGNEVGALLTEYLLSERKLKNTLPHNPIIVKTIVTSELIALIAKKYGAMTVNLLTGFKYIGELITNLEETNEANRYVLGMEESYGYLAGTHARDKDAVVASALICEMAAFYKKQGKTLVDVMNDLYKEHGMYLNTLLNFGFEGAEGMEKMNSMMLTLRENAPKKIGDFNVIRVSDYKTSRSIETETGIMKQISLPKSNVLDYQLSGDNSVIVRPSGTEPKIKVYITARADNKKNAEKLTKKITTDIEKILEIG